MCECFFLSFIHSLNELKWIIIANCGWRIHWRFECLECIQWICAQRKCDIQKKILLMWNENIDRKLKIKNKEFAPFGFELRILFISNKRIILYLDEVCVCVFHLSYFRIVCSTKIFDVNYFAAIRRKLLSSSTSIFSLFSYVVPLSYPTNSCLNISFTIHQQQK